MVVAAKPPQLPKVSLPKVERAHLFFIDQLNGWHGEILDDDKCASICRLISLPDPQSGNLFETLLQYAGRRVDDRLKDMISRQLAARMKELEHGPIQMFSDPVISEWVPMEVFRVVECPWRDNALGCRLKLYCLSGRPAGSFLYKKFPESWMAYFAYRLGFSRRVQYDYNLSHFIGLRFWGYVVSVELSDGKLDFEDWKLDSGMSKHNKTIIAKRTRFDIDPDKLGVNSSCAFDFDHYCHECPKSIHSCIAVPNRERTYAGPSDW